jgi:hypothetical protein
LAQEQQSEATRLHVFSAQSVTLAEDHFLEIHIDFPHWI